MTALFRIVDFLVCTVFVSVQERFVPNTSVIFIFISYAE